VPQSRLCNEGKFAGSGRKKKLTEKTIEKTASGEVLAAATGLPPKDRAVRSSDSAALPALNGANGSAPAGAREDQAPQGEIAAADGADPATPRVPRSEERRVRRAARVESRKRPSDQPVIPGADSDAAELGASAVLVAAEAPGEAPTEGDTPIEVLAEGDAPLINLTGSGKRGARTVRRASKKQQAAADAVEAADDNPALGALNRHLNTMMQQLSTAHRIIGRVAAERDALRQQLADLQGIPVEEIVVSTVGASTEASAQPARSSQPSAPSEPSRFAKLNYFGGDDVAVMRKRRQKLVLGILGFIIVLWIASRMGFWALPDKLSRDSLGNLPYVGDFMTIFLAGWLFFRVIRVSSKGVKWVFPSEDQRRRRR
jgi:hypothetical protein